MKNVSLKEVANKALGSILKKYQTKEAKFQPYLLSLENNSDIDIFIDQLFTNKDKLGLKLEEIKELLDCLGETRQVVDILGVSFFNLWLEFSIMQFGELTERIKARDIVNFPGKENDQLIFLKTICETYIPGSPDQQNKILDELKKSPIYKLYMQFLMEKDKKPSQSRLGKVSKSKDLQSLNLSDRSKCSQAFLKKILDKIGVVNNIEDPLDVHENLQKFFEDTLEKNNIQSELIRIDLKEVLFNILHQSIKNNICTANEKSENVLKASYRLFEKFYVCCLKVKDVTIKALSISQFLDDFERIIYQCPTAWLWPTLEEASLIVFVRNQCVQNKQLNSRLIELLNKHPPNLQAKIFSFKNRTFLHQSLYNLPATSEKGNYLRCLLKLAQLQKVNFQTCLATGESYYRMFVLLGVQERELIDCKSEIDINASLFYIYDRKKNQKINIYMNKQDISELLDKIINPRFERGSIDSHLYFLEYQIANNYCFASYRSLQQNIKGSIQCEGPLMYTNLLDLEDRIKELQWRIITLKGEEKTFSPGENQKLGEQLYKLNRNKDFSPFTLKVGSGQEIIEIDPKTLQVTAMVSMPNSDKFNYSKVKEKFGFLIFLPAYKKRIDEETQIEEPDEMIRTPLLMHSKKAFTPQFMREDSEDSEENSEQAKENEKEISLETVFKHLGAFEGIFNIDEQYRLDKKKNIHTQSKTAIDYFQKWQELEIFRHVNKYLTDKPSSKFPPNISREFKFPRHAYPTFDQQQQKFYNQYKSRIFFKYNNKNESLFIQNMVATKQASEYFVAFLDYLTLCAQEQNSKQNFVLKLNKTQQNYLQQSKLPGVKIIDKQDKGVEIQCTRKEKEKIAKDLEKLDEIIDFTISSADIDVFELMKTHDQDYLKRIDLIEKSRGEQSIVVSFQLKYYPQFLIKLKMFKQMLAEMPAKSIQLSLKNEGKYLHLYRSQMQKVDPSITVIKMLDDILIQYSNKDEKKIKNALSNLDRLKQQQLFQIARRSGKQYYIKGVKSAFIFHLKQKLQELLKSKGQQVLQALIKLNLIKQDQYSLTGLQISKQQEELLAQIMKVFAKSFEIFKECKRQIYNTEMFFSKLKGRIPQNLQYSNKIKDLYMELKVMLRSSILEIVEPCTEKYNSLLEQQFDQYINSPLNSLFSSKVNNTKQQQLQLKAQNMNLFSKFLTEKIDQTEKDFNMANAAAKVAVFKELQTSITNLQTTFKTSTVQGSQLKKYLKGIHILLTIYYGPQLPITCHLSELSKQLETNDVVMVKVGTGSGKSTVIPPYLIGKGYKKVVVTQPRRLPCRQIFKRINSIFGEGIAGYAVGDSSKNAKNNLVYMTDGLLKTQVIYKEQIFDSIDVLIIDEIHERSASIDVLLLLLYCYFLTPNRKLKVILCSATIDEQIGQIMKAANLKVGLFEPQIPSKFTITEHPIQKGTIIQTILELSKKLKNDEQLLAFYPGVNEAQKAVQILKTTFHLRACVIKGNQNSKLQDELLANERVFVSTAIAETSLTFKNLKYVVDSRRSRWRTFDEQLELMKTEEDYSSNSSIKQRKGRVGRTSNGQYYFYVYQDHDFVHNKEHNLTQLQKSDFTQYIFELLLRKNEDFNGVVDLLRKLNHNPTQFNKKIEHSKQILANCQLLQKNGKLHKKAYQLQNYGNLGNPQHNEALRGASETHCFLNVAYLISFFMYGSIKAGEMIKHCAIQYKGGDLKILHDFFVDIGNKINIVGVKESEIYQQMRVKCKSLTDKPWYNLLVRIMVKTKQLLRADGNNMSAPSNRWDDIVDIFTEVYKNKIFFNQSLFGGSKTNFQKIKGNEVLNYQCKKLNQQKVTFILNKSSLYQKNPPKIVISFDCSISPQDQCLLSICQEVPLAKMKELISVELIGSQCSNQFFDNTNPLNEKQVFDELVGTLNLNFNGSVTYNFPSLIISSNFNSVVSAFEGIIEPKRKNVQLKISLAKMLDKAIDRRFKHSMVADIPKEQSMVLLQKLSFNDYENLFSTMKYEMQNDYGITMRWDTKESTITVKDAKNIHVSKILYKLQNFLKWLSQCQMISREQYKIKPQYIGDIPNNIVSYDNKVKIMKRINQIVDSNLQPYILKGWVTGRGPTQEPRTSRMIAVCWILVNKFDCVLKGGFVRDWVINASESIPKTSKQRRNLLQPNPRNKFLQVTDDTVVPSDIDAQLSYSTLFVPQRFKKQMDKLGIAIKIEDDGWRKHILFDHQTDTGGFTADLIQPFTSMTHFTYDFDVNTMYIKKNNLNAIGMKIPLVYEDNFKNKKTTIHLGDLIANCINKTMTTLKSTIPAYRFTKFETRKWTIINQQMIQPVCYKSQFTQIFPIHPDEIKTISPIFYQKIVVELGCKVKRIENLSNRGWDEAFQSAQHWIVTELQRSAKQKDKAGYKNQNFNSNNKILFHGTKDITGAKGIKQSGFDSRFYASGCMYGRGAYFAQDPAKSHAYTGSGPDRHMFIVNVALGNQQRMPAAANNKTGPSKGFHSILGVAGSAVEYIIDRWGQAKPLCLIVYQ